MESSRGNNNNNTLLVLDCGSKLFDQLCYELERQHIPFICRSLSPIRYCDHINSPRIRSLSDIIDLSFNGIIISGSSRYNPNLNGAPFLPVGLLDYIYQYHIPVLGLCYGMQMLAATFDGIIEKNPLTDYEQRVHECQVIAPSRLFGGLPSKFPVFLFHKHRVEQIPPGFNLIAQANNLNTKMVISPHIGIQYESNDGHLRIYGLQFHPESNETSENVRNAIFHNFWNMCH